jgi:hypothetical protein
MKSPSFCSENSTIILLRDEILTKVVLVYWFLKPIIEGYENDFRKCQPIFLLEK